MKVEELIVGNYGSMCTCIFLYIVYVFVLYQRCLRDPELSSELVRLSNKKSYEIVQWSRPAFKYLVLQMLGTKSSVALKVLKSIWPEELGVNSTVDQYLKDAQFSRVTACCQWVEILLPHHIHITHSHSSFHHRHKSPLNTLQSCNVLSTMRPSYHRVILEDGTALLRNWL